MIGLSKQVEPIGIKKTVDCDDVNQYYITMETAFIKEVKCMNEPQSYQDIMKRGRNRMKTKQW